MPRQAEPRHVSRERSSLAVVLVDVLQNFPGEEGRQLHERAQAIVPAVQRLVAAARRHRVPVLYVNDQHGRWDSSREQTVSAAVRGPRGDIARALHPKDHDLFVLKPGRSAFYQSPFEVLLESLGVTRLVLAGVATDVCVLATASDAAIRKLRCAVPRDTCETLTADRQRAAMLIFEEGLGVDTRPSERLRWPAGKVRRAGGG